MVVKNVLSDDAIDRVFRALADATRRDILRRTIDAEWSVSNLARDYDMSFAAVQKHVAVLEAARLVVKRAEGRERLVRADPAMIARARRLLDRYESMWRSRIDRLDALLAEPADAEAPSPQPASADAVTSASTEPHPTNDTTSARTAEGD